MRALADSRVGNAHDMIDRSTRIGLYAVADLRRDIASAIASSTSYAEALDAVTAAVNQHAASDTIAASVTVPASMADMGGRLMVYGNTQRVALARGDDELVQFLTLPFEEAIAEFKRRVPQSATELETLLAGYRVRGVQARELMLETLRANVRDQVIASMENGTGFRTFQTEVNGTLDALGITPASPSYLETVYRTNVQGAYGAGRWQAMQDPDVVAELPLWEYRAVGDGRTRANHQALDGLLFEIGNPATDGLAPPGGFNCRCSAVSIASASGRTVTRAVPSNGVPDPGFGNAPGLWLPA
jgi:SPP1 gp7 family putative phage head morphogenesis protein